MNEYFKKFPNYDTEYALHRHGLDHVQQFSNLKTLHKFLSFTLQSKQQSPTGNKSNCAYTSDSEFLNIPHNCVQTWHTPVLPTWMPCSWCAVMAELIRILLQTQVCDLLVGGTKRTGMILLFSQEPMTLSGTRNSNLFNDASPGLSVN